MITPINPVVPIITIALRAVSDSGKLNIFLPTMDKERTVPMISMPIPVLSASLLFLSVIFLLAPIPIFPLLPVLSRPSMSYNDARPRRPT